MYRNLASFQFSFFPAESESLSNAWMLLCSQFFGGSCNSSTMLQKLGM